MNYIADVVGEAGVGEPAIGDELVGEVEVAVGVVGGPVGDGYSGLNTLRKECIEL